MSLLDIDLALRRPSALFWLALALMVPAVALHVFGTLPVKARIDERIREQVQAKLPSSAAAPITPEKSLLEERLAAFVGALGEKREIPAMLGTLFEQAEKHGLVLAQAEYKLELDRAGGFYAYQMRLPVRGSYPRLRRFVDATLAGIRCAALEDIDFKRDAIGATETEAQLRFVFFLKEAG